MQENSNRENKSKLVPPVSGLIILLVLSCILNRLFSWLRTFFYLNNWTNGTNSLYSILFCIGIILLIVFFWFATCYAWYSDNKYSFLPLCISFVFIGITIFRVNSIVNRAVLDQRTRLEEESSLIKSIEESAVLPVYASETSEIYQRSIGGLSEHIFSTEELSREPKGTILTDSQVEAFGILSSGGVYTELNESTGLYTYDDKVKEVLSENGYTLTNYFTGKRYCNLEEVARCNEAGFDKGTMVLNGPARAITSNTEVDQFTGTYQVRLVFSGLEVDRVEGDVIGSIEVLGESGDRAVLKSDLLLSDFVDGRCERILAYHTDDIPLVSFAIDIKDGVHLNVEEISWWRVSSNPDILKEGMSTEEAIDKVKQEATELTLDVCYCLLSGNEYDAILIDEDIPDAVFAYVLTEHGIFNLSFNQFGAFSECVPHGMMNEKIAIYYTNTDGKGYYFYPAPVPAPVECISYVKNVKYYEGAVFDKNSQQYIFTTTLEDNRFNAVNLQLWSESGEYLGPIASVGTTGAINDTYTHELETGWYIIRLKGNTNLRDVYIDIFAFLQEGQCYEYGYDVDSLEEKRIAVSDYYFNGPI